MGDVVPQEAIDFIKGKELTPAFSYKDVWQAEHAHAFTVAKCMQLDLLKDIHESLIAALKNGIPYKQWAKSMQETMENAGWWGKSDMVDPLTGETKRVQLGSPRRIKVIFDTNIRSAYQAGDWAKAQQSIAHPYLMYRLGPAKKHREEHVAWDGLLLPKDDPWWDLHTPPNGYGCQCGLVAVTKAKAERLKEEGIIDETKRRYKQPLVYKPVKLVAPPDETVEYYNKRKGTTYEGIKGITPGFEYNPGNPKSRMERIAEVGKATEQEFRHSVSGSTEPTKESLRNPVSAGFSAVDKAIRPHASHAFSCISKVHGDGKLPKIPMKTSRAKSYNGQFETRGSFASAIRISGSDHKELTVLHEVGHYLDNAAFPKANGMVSFASSSPGSSKMAKLMDALRKSEAVKGIVSSGYKVGYYTKPTEMIARSYAQYIAVKTQDAVLISQLNGILDAGTGYRYSQWTDSDFRPILEAYDELLEEMGWLKRMR